MMELTNFGAEEKFVNGEESFSPQNAILELIEKLFKKVDYYKFGDLNLNDFFDLDPEITIDEQNFEGLQAVTLGLTSAFEQYFESEYEFSNVQVHCEPDLVLDFSMNFTGRHQPMMDDGESTVETSGVISGQISVEEKLEIMALTIETH